MARKKKTDDLPEGTPLPLDKKPKFTSSQEYLDKSHAELLEFASKRILTSAIKCLETFEENWGDQWKHFSKEKKTRDEERQYHKWKNARKFILAYAHDQIELLKEEFEFFDVSKRWFNIHIEMKDEDD